MNTLILSVFLITAGQDVDLTYAGIAVEDVGQLSATVTNWGILSTTPMFVTPSLHWPQNAPFEQHYCYGLQFILAKDGEVLTVPNALVHFDTDWQPELHHNPDNQSPLGIPWLAMSDNSTTWPPEGWPGPYRVDPSSGDTVYGEFTSDRDIYAAFNDAGRFGIRVEMLTYGYGRYYAEDILFYRLFIENTSDSTLHDIHIGLFVAFRVDFDFQDFLDFVDLWPEGAPDGTKDFVYYWDADGVPLSPWESVGMMGVGFLATPDSLGITDFHWFSRSYTPYNDATYWPIVVSDTSDTNINPSFYFHGDDIHMDCTPPDSASGYNLIAAVGPFDLEPGERKEFSLFVAAGADTAELFANARTAFKMSEFEYQGPSAPPPPVLRYVVLPDRVRLYWDASPSETTPDPFTGQLDFEGYKVYRSEDGGMTWGEPITNERGEVVNYVPIAIYDLIDGIKGVDPAWPYQSLGEDAGVRYVFEDTTVIPGHIYYYTVTAYDKGVQDPDSLAPSLESRRGANMVRVEFFARPSDYTPGELSIESVGKPTTGEVQAVLVDPDSLLDATYRIEFSSDSFCFGTGDVEIVDTAFCEPIPDTGVLWQSNLLDGFRLTVRNSPEGFMEVGWSSPDVGFDWFVEDRGRGEALHEGYGDALFIVDTIQGSEAQVLRPNSFRYDLPFVPVDTTYWIPIRGFAVFGDDTVEADTIFVVDPIFLGGFASPPRVSDTGWTLTPGGEAWVPDEHYRYLLPDQLGLVAHHGDEMLRVFVRTLNPPDATPPTQGDTFFIKLFKPLREGVAFRIESHASQMVANGDPLANVTVYPNPLVVEAGFGREIHFRNLPSRATIRIYTIAGEPVATIEHEGGGEAVWDLTNRSGLKVAYGLYFYIVETPDGKTKKGKFAIVR